MKVCFVLDIDTTLADNSHRACLLKRHCNMCLGSIDTVRKPSQCPSCGGTSFGFDQASWDSFMDHAVVANDQALPKAVKVIQHVRRLGAPIVYLTGRNEGMREVTDIWLTKHFGKTQSEELLMRSLSKAAVPASVYKEQAVLELKETMPGTFFIFMEDDSHVFSVYNKHGLCIKCPEAWEFLMPTGLKGGEQLYDR